MPCSTTVTAGKQMLSFVCGPRVRCLARSRLIPQSKDVCLLLRVRVLTPHAHDGDDGFAGKTDRTPVAGRRTTVTVVTF